MAAVVCRDSSFVFQLSFCSGATNVTSACLHNFNFGFLIGFCSGMTNHETCLPVYLPEVGRYQHNLSRFAGAESPDVYVAVSDNKAKNMAESNPNSRLEAFCDGVFAIALTLLIIDIKLPSTENIHTNAELLLALKNLTPSILAFLLSFIVILITWVNHHAALKLVHKSSSHFIYANGLLLLATVFVPFPTSLLGDFVLTDHAAPAVALYSAVFGLQAIAWALMTRAVLNPANPLVINEKAIRTGRVNLKRAYYASALYTACAIAAFWFPLIIAIFVGITWVIWLIIGINLKE